MVVVGGRVTKLRRTVESSARNPPKNESRRAYVAEIEPRDGSVRVVSVSVPAGIVADLAGIAL